MTSMIEDRPGSAPSARPQSAAHGKRDDIQGLRAVAVMLVVAYHAGVPRVPGGFVGVDVFFVLSGFLITQLLLREAAATGTISLRQFWARRARRIIPASALVLAATMLAVRAFTSPLDRPAIGTDAIWAALFSGNWRFAQQQTDYLASDRDPSPVLHYWSLGVEEQFYVVWPLLVLALAAVWVATGRHRRAYGWVFGGVFALVTLASLAWCIRTTTTDQPYAFFGTPARAWQLAAGALVAVAVPAVVRWGRRSRAALGVTGLVLLGLCVVLLEESGSAAVSYPSWLAIGPTLAGVLLIVSGTGTGSRLQRGLSVRPLTYVGDLSYSLYLWHWPVLVIGMEALDARTPAVRLGLVALAAALSVASYHVVENPVRRTRLLVRRPGRSIALGAVLVAAVVPVAAYASQSPTIDRVVVESGADRDGPVPVPQKVTPSLQDAADDEGPFKDMGCQVGFDRTTLPSWDGCTFADKGSPDEVLVLGDSISGAIAPAVVKAGKENRWAVTVWAKARCPVADVTKFDPMLGGAYDECDTFRESALRAVEERHPDVVVLAMSRASTSEIAVDGGHIEGRRAVEEGTRGLQRTVERLQAAGVRVVLSDSPNRAPFAPTSCLADKRDVRECSFKADRGPSIMAATSRAMGDAVAFVAANAAVCPGRLCLPVVDNVVVYSDRIHFTRTYAETLTDELADGIRAAAPHLARPSG